MKDLVCLCADRSIEAALGGVLGRHEALGIRQISFDIHVHPRRDPGCFTSSHEFLRPLRRQYRFALVIFDAEWEGAPTQTAAALEDAVRNRFQQCGLGEWAEPIVIEPELEVWVWSDSPVVDRVLGWHGHEPGLRPWLRAEGLWPEGHSKPPKPKEAMERAVLLVRQPWSSSLFGQIAKSVSLTNCVDGSFQRLCHTLHGWFPA